MVVSEPKIITLFIHTAASSVFRVVAVGPTLPQAPEHTSRKQ